MKCEACKGTGDGGKGKPCFECDGTGSKCDVCGEACDAGADLCDDCREEAAGEDADYE
jgi:RecJ-like exonuclease